MSTSFPLPGRGFNKVSQQVSKTRPNTFITELTAQNNRRHLFATSGFRYRAAMKALIGKT